MLYITRFNMPMVSVLVSNCSKPVISFCHKFEILAFVRSKTGTSNISEIMPKSARCVSNENVNSHSQNDSLSRDCVDGNKTGNFERRSKTETNKDLDAIREFEVAVDIENLTSQEFEIHRRHLNAIKACKSFYVDPETGYDVMTRLAHQQRGDCCGNACRHCPYGHRNVPESKRTKKNNTAFYV